MLHVSFLERVRNVLLFQFLRIVFDSPTNLFGIPVILSNVLGLNSIASVDFGHFTVQTQV